jgi:hypothetical protein
MSCFVEKRSKGRRDVVNEAGSVRYKAEEMVSARA